MSDDLAIFLSKKLLWTAILISAPAVIASLTTGLIVSILQAVTQIQDSSLNLVPKILTVLVMLILCGPWMLQTLLDFAKTIYLEIPRMLR